MCMCEYMYACTCVKLCTHMCSVHIHVWIHLCINIACVSVYLGGNELASWPVTVTSNRVKVSNSVGIKLNITV